MFHVTKELAQKIETIQIRSILSMGVTPKEWLKNNTVPKYWQDEFNPQKLSLEEMYSSLGNFYALMPEFHYDTTFDYFKFLSSCGVTDYDNYGFLQRFSNLINLCHDVFTDGNKELRKNIIVTSLPFFNLNGFCSKQGDTNIIFLNQGLLSIIPHLYRFLLPFYSEEIFGEGKKGTNLDNAIGLIFEAYLFSDGYHNLRNNSSIMEPNGNEKWYFKDSLKRHILDSKSKLFKEHPSEFTFNVEKAQFLACRGAFLFILGHEFSHAYNNHCDLVLSEGLNLRDQQMLDICRNNFDEELSQYQDLVQKNKNNFCVHQPIEEEADAHAFHCVFKYCKDNNLDDKRTDCVLLGAAFVFLIMELHRRFATVNELGWRNAEVYFSHNPFLMNILFAEEHPFPLTRIVMLMRGFKNEYGVALFSKLDDKLSQVFELIWNHISSNLDKIEKHLRTSNILNIDMNEIFQDIEGFGFNDFSPTYYAHIKQFVKK